MDNDSKHYVDKTLQLLATNNIGLMASMRLNENGFYPDRIPGRFGRMTLCLDEKFPAYSPDVNGPIEKCWREMDRRVKLRHQEINSWKNMKKIIKEEWNGLNFEQNENWVGINHLILKIPQVLKDIVSEKGFDTIHMKK